MLMEFYIQGLCPPTKVIFFFSNHLYMIKDINYSFQVLLSCTLTYCKAMSFRLTKRGADADAIADPAAAAGGFFNPPGFGGGLPGFYGFQGGPSYNHYHYGGGVRGGSNQQYYGEYYNNR